MNSKRKGFLLASSIITIVAATFGVLFSMILALIGSFFTEATVKETYQTDEVYTYYENADGSYYFTYLDELGTEIIITEEDIELESKVFTTMFYTWAFGNLSFSVAKLALAIVILVGTVKNKYKKGCVIALLTISVLNANLLEAAFLIVAMCINDNPKNENIEQTKPLGLDDIKIEDINLD